MGADRYIFDKYYKGMCYFAYTLLGDMHLAEDFAQEAFIAFYRKREEIKNEEKVIKSYLYTSIKNSVSNWARHNKVQEKYWLRTGFSEQDDLDIHHALIETEVMTEIYRIVSELPSACQTIFRLSYFEGFSNQEISEQLNLSVNTVKTQKRRGLKHIQSRLDPEFFLLFISFLSQN